MRGRSVDRRARHAIAEHEIDVVTGADRPHRAHRLARRRPHDGISALERGEWTQRVQPPRGGFDLKTPALDVPNAARREPAHCIRCIDPRTRDVIRGQPGEQPRNRAQPLAQLRLHGHGRLGRGRRRRSAQIGDEVADRHVDFVPDRRDRRDGAAREGAGDALVVECPEVLTGTTATSDDQHVGLAPSRDAVERGA